VRFCAHSSQPAGATSRTVRRDHGQVRPQPEGPLFATLILRGSAGQFAIVVEGPPPHARDALKPAATATLVARLGGAAVAPGLWGNTMQGFEPMLSGALDDMPSSDDYWAEPKWDGWRSIAGLPRTARSGRGWLETRTGNRINSLPYIIEALQASLPGNTILDGEIIDPTLGAVTESRSAGWNRVQHLASTDRVHKPTPDDPPLVYVVFDMLVLAGDDMRALPLLERRGLLHDLFKIDRDHVGDDPLFAADWKFLFAEGPIAPAVVALSKVAPCTAETLDAWLEAGFEGAMVKHVRSRYVSGGRPSGAWYKVKPQDTEDVVFLGTYAPSAGSKYDGVAVGGFRFKRSNGYEGRCAGMTDAVRQEFHDEAHAAQYVGMVFELAHHGETVDGALRHPQFVRWRDPADKGADDVLGKNPIIDQAEADGVKAANARGRARNRRASAAPASGPSGRMRNYRAMGDEKLLRCLRELSEGSGDAYSRCVNSGSGDPAADLAVVEDLVEERVLVQA
jgi:ATP-dependent DNA ligase